MILFLLRYYARYIGYYNRLERTKGHGKLLTKPFYWEKTTHGITKYNIGQQQSLIVDKVCD